MYKLCKTEQSAQRQRTLELGLLSAIEKSDYDQISVSDLCDQLEVPRKSFYRYFDSKDGALQALLDHTLMEYEVYTGHIISSSRVRTAHSEMESFFQFWEQKKGLLDALQRSNLSNALIERALRYARSSGTIPRRFLSEDNQDNQHYLATFTVYGIMALVLEWHQAGYPQSASHMATLAVRLVSGPLFTNLNLL